MAENNSGSAQAGSPIANSVPNPNNFGAPAGQTPAAAPAAKEVLPQIDPVQHKELESLVGRQGQELGEFRKFFSDIAPLLDKLDKSPEIVQAIIDGNITADLAKAAMQGKVSIADAKVVSQAHEEVKKELGKEGYQGASPDEVKKLVEEKAKEIRDDLQKELKERDDLSTFESNVNEFIARTSDFTKYASDIDKWLEAKKQADIDKAEAEKSGALSMGGGSGRATYVQNDPATVDSLIASKSNPNIF